MAVEDDLQTLDEIGRAAQEYGSSVSPYAGLQDYLLQRHYYLFFHLCKNNGLICIYLILIIFLFIQFSTI